MGGTVIKELPHHVKDKARYVFGEDIELPEIKLVSSCMRAQTHFNDIENTIEIVIPYRDYYHPMGFAIVHELGHWYHCSKWPKYSDSCTMLRCEAAALLVEMLVFLDPVSPYFDVLWTRRLQAFDKQVLSVAIFLFGGIKSGMRTLDSAIECCLIEGL